eukprot:1160514-Pelagomonas_calceolata.AAC.12
MEYQWLEWLGLRKKIGKKQIQQNRGNVHLWNKIQNIGGKPARDNHFQQQRPPDYEAKGTQIMSIGKNRKEELESIEPA